MKISCRIADDLLPLYLDDSCSEDSRAALKEHLKECPSCCAKLARMQSGIMGEIQIEKSVPKLASYAKKVRNHRIRIAILVVLVTVIAAAVLALGYLTIRDMHEQVSPYIHEVEAGTYNLTAADLEVTAEEIGQYVLFTNYAQISVTVYGEGSFQGTVMLHDAENSENFIRVADVNEKTNTCTFTTLSSARRYIITCENLDGAEITVSEGRTADFWNSLKSVLNELIRR